MRATIIHAPGDIRFEEVPDPVLSTGGDAIVRVVAACGRAAPTAGATAAPRPCTGPARIGHECPWAWSRRWALQVEKHQPVGDFVIAPFYDCDMTCVNRRNGISTSCLHGGWWGPTTSSAVSPTAARASASACRTPTARSWRHPAQPAPELIPHPLTLSDVMGTGHHAALSGGAGPGKTVVAVGDGAVGPVRRARIRAPGCRAHRGDVAASGTPGAGPPLRRDRRGGGARQGGRRAHPRALRRRRGGCGARGVGTADSMDQALRSARPGGQVGFVGVPHGPSTLPLGRMFSTNVGVRGGVAPVRNYVEELLPEVRTAGCSRGPCSTSSCPWRRSPRRTRRWTSVARSRCC